MSFLDLIAGAFRIFSDDDGNELLDAATRIHFPGAAKSYDLELEADVIDYLTPGVISVTVAENQNNWNPAGWQTASIVRVDTTGASGAVTLTGMVAPSGYGAQYFKTIARVAGPQNLTWADNSGSSSAGNKCLTGTVTPSLATGDAVTWFYDTVSLVWRPLP